MPELQLVDESILKRMTSTNGSSTETVDIWYGWVFVMAGQVLVTFKFVLWEIWSRLIVFEISPLVSYRVMVPHFLLCCDDQD